MGIRIEIQRAVSGSGLRLPSDSELRTWARRALSGHLKDADLCIRLTSEDEIQTLNNTYRHKNKTTNVLSFPVNICDDDGRRYLGDIVICAKVVIAEAKQQKKTLRAHWAHMVVHGVLHLLGYDHIEDSQANIMETLESKILDTLGFPNPYQINGR